jgi:hypothetical protein
MAERKPHLKPEAWIKIRTRYELGESVTELGKQYGIAKQTICSRARRHKWAKKGSASDELVAKAKAKIETKLGEEYEALVTEVNVQSIEDYRYVSKFARHLMVQQKNRVMAIENASAYDEAQYYAEHKAKRTAILVKEGRDIGEPRPFIPLDIGKEIYRLNQIVDVMDKATIKSTRYLLGIEGKSIAPDQNSIADDGLCQMIDTGTRLYKEQIRRNEAEYREQIRAEIRAELEKEMANAK